MSNPAVTVLMSVYNGEEHLRYSIESILNQTFREFEFLIIDDASTDTTKDIVLSYSDPRIELVENNVNIGLTRSLNKGMNLARGKYVARMDADDVSLPERLRKQYEFMLNNSKAAVVGSWAQGINDMGDITGSIKTLTSPDHLYGELFFTNPLVHSSVILEKKFIQEIGGYNEDLKRAQDYELWVRVAKHHGQIYNLPLYLLKYRDHANNVSNTHSERQEAVAQKAIQYAYSSLINYNVSLNKIALLRGFCLHPNTSHGCFDKMRAFILLRQLKKVFKSNLTTNRDAVEYLQNRINSIEIYRIGSKMKNIIKNSIMTAGVCL